MKLKEYIKNRPNADILEQIVAGMLVFDGFPDTVNTDFIPIYTMREGLCAFVDDIGGGLVGHAGICGEPGYNGLGRDVIVSFDDGTVRTYTDYQNNEHVVVMWNDLLMRPDLQIGRFSHMLTQVDTSMLLNVIYSRYLPIPAVKDEDTKRAVDNILTMLKTGGDLSAVVQNDIISDILGRGNGIDLINISDVANADKLQYLSLFHDDLMRRFYQIYGFDVDGTGKRAQETVAEVGSRQGVSMIYPYSRYRAAKRAIDQINKKFAWDVSVAFGWPWAVDFNADGVPDDIQPEGLPDNAGEPNDEAEEVTDNEG